MPVSNPNKTISTATMDCGGTATVTLSFQAEPLLQTAPADFVLLLDRSGSMNGAPMLAAKTAAAQLIDTVARASGSADGTALENGSRLGLVSFADDAVSNVALTDDVAALDRAVDGLNAGGFTNHEAAFLQAGLMLQSSANLRKVVILFTDGATTTGGDPNPAAESLRQSGAEIFCIGLATDATPLNAWASDPDSTHVSLASTPSRLADVFAAVAAEAVMAGSLDMELTEILNPDFKIVKIDPPSHGVAAVVDPQTLQWTAGAIGAAGPETAKVTFQIAHISGTGGTRQINQSLTYTDRQGNTLDFPNPSVLVSCAGPVLYPDPCPLPVTFVAEPCRDSVSVTAHHAVMNGLGRIVQVNVTVGHVCPGKQVAVAVILTELDADGVEHARGMKTLLIPAQPGTECQDIQLRCISFVVPELLDAGGSPDSLCNPRGFRTRVLANYTDSDFSCCDPQTVIL